jgi:hypothetical protein
MVASSTVRRPEMLSARRVGRPGGEQGNTKTLVELLSCVFKVAPPKSLSLYLQRPFGRVYTVINIGGLEDGRISEYSFYC